MKVLILICLGISLLVLSEADPLPNPDVQDGQNDITGVPAALIAEKQLKFYHELMPLQSPHSRVKRSKKKVVVINQYYGGHPQGGYGGYGGGYPRQYGGYGGGYQPYGYNQQPYGYYDNHQGGGGKGGKLFKKLKKFGR